MKKVTTFLIFSLSLILYPATVYALPENGNTRRSEVKQMIDEKRQLRQEMLQEIRQRVRDRRATQEAKLTELRKNLIRNFWVRLKARLTAAMERLEKLIARIESRLTKIEENNEGIDTELVKEQLEDAKVKLAEAKAKCQAANDTMEDVLNSNDPKAAFGVVRDTVKDIKSDLVDVHRTLVHVIGDIKGLRVGSTDGNGGGPTSTPTATATPVLTLTPTAVATPTPTP